MFNNDLPFFGSSGGSDGGKLALDGGMYYCYRGQNLNTLESIDTSNVTNFSSMFSYCSSLTTIPLLDTSNGTNFNSMFSYCSSLTTIPLLDTSNGTDFSTMFSGCSSLTKVSLNTNKGTSFRDAFYQCTNLTEVSLTDTSNASNFASMFNNCTNLKTISTLDLTNSDSYTSMFYNCSALENISFTKIRIYNSGFKVNNSPNLTLESLLSILNALSPIDTTTTRTVYLGSANLQKLTADQKAIATQKKIALS